MTEKEYNLIRERINADLKTLIEGCGNPSPLVIKGLDNEVLTAIARALPHGVMFAELSKLSGLKKILRSEDVNEDLKELSEYQIDALATNLVMAGAVRELAKYAYVDDPKGFLADVLGVPPLAPTIDFMQAVASAIDHDTPTKIIDNYEMELMLC